MPHKGCTGDDADLSRETEMPNFNIIARDSRTCFGLHYLASREEAEFYGKHVRDRGDRVNGGMFDGMPCGRAPEFDHDKDGQRRYAVRVA